MSTSDKLLVAAIYLGTTHSSIAYSFILDYDTNPLKICSYQWSSTHRYLVSPRTLTCVLFNKDKVFDSFGNEAEIKYSELAKDEEHQEWYFFKDFKLSLLNKMEPLSKTVKISTTDWKDMMAIDVFSAAIKFLRNAFLDSRKCDYAGLREADIHWVLTVPSIWDDAAKHFMREAAEKAGISASRLLIVPEPEAGFLFCKNSNIQMNKENYSSVNVGYAAGTKCMVVIAEEMGVEIAVYDVQHRGILKKLYSTYNFDWDGNKVNSSLCSLLTDIVGDDVMKEFLSEHEDDFHQFLTYFKYRRNLLKPNKTGKFKLSIPMTLEKTFLEMNPGGDINAMIASKPKYNKKVIFVRDQLQIDAEMVTALFHESCSKIIYHIQELFLYPTLKDVSYIQLLGNYALSPILEFGIREAFKFSDKEVIVPQNAEYAVVQGAVMYGHQQTSS